MTLSGWTRLWIVASAIWWVNGWDKVTRVDAARGLLPMPRGFTRGPGEPDWWALWFQQRWGNGDLPFYLFAPFIVGIIGLAVWWTMKRYPSEKKSSPSSR